MYLFFLKRLFDFIVSLVGLLVLFPLLLLIFIYLKLTIKGSPFFVHARPGLNEKIFHVIKFKTMNDKKDEFGNLLPNHLRITKVGSFLRKSSLDEIPQLLNVIKGDISLVGPRPLEVRYLEFYSTEQRKRHLVRPGITGWAQVNGRNSISWEQKFEYDNWYIENISFLLDMKILFLTVVKVFKSEGINMNKNETMIPFDVYMMTKNK